MKVDIHNLKKAVARELSLYALLFKNTIDKKYRQKMETLCSKQNTHKNFTKEKIQKSNE